MKASVSDDHAPHSPDVDRHLVAEVETRPRSGEPREVQPPKLGEVIAFSLVGGLHHRYERRAA
jgi:hypothetical protein